EPLTEICNLLNDYGRSTPGRNFAKPPIRNDQGETVPRERPPGIRHEQPLPTQDAWFSSHVFKRAEQEFPIWPVATLRPVIKGAVAAVPTAWGTATAASTG